MNISRYMFKDECEVRGDRALSSYSASDISKVLFNNDVVVMCLVLEL